MRLNEEYLERVEELFDLIANEEGDIELDLAMDRLRKFLENDVDGWTHFSGEELSLKCLAHLEDIKSLIHCTQTNPELEEALAEVMADMEHDVLSPSSESDGFETNEEDEFAETEGERADDEEELWD